MPFSFYFYITIAVDLSNELSILLGPDVQNTPFMLIPDILLEHRTFITGM